MNYNIYIYIKFIFSLYSSSIAKSKCSCLKKSPSMAQLSPWPSLSMGVPEKWMVYFMDNPTIKLMI